MKGEWQWKYSTSLTCGFLKHFQRAGDQEEATDQQEEDGESNGAVRNLLLPAIWVEETDLWAGRGEGEGGRGRGRTREKWMRNRFFISDKVPVQTITELVVIVILYCLLYLHPLLLMQHPVYLLTCLENENALFEKPGLQTVALCVLFADPTIPVQKRAVTISR